MPLVLVPNGNGIGESSNAKTEETGEDLEAVLSVGCMAIILLFLCMLSFFLEWNIDNSNLFAPAPTTL